MFPLSRLSIPVQFYDAGYIIGPFVRRYFNDNDSNSMRYGSSAQLPYSCLPIKLNSQTNKNYKTKTTATKMCTKISHITKRLNVIKIFSTFSLLTLRWSIKLFIYDVKNALNIWVPSISNDNLSSCPFSCYFIIFYVAFSTKHYNRLTVVSPRRPIFQQVQSARTKSSPTASCNWSCHW